MKRCITFLAVNAALAILLIMPFTGIKGTSDTALALTEAECRACHTEDSKTLHHSLCLQCGVCHTSTWDGYSYTISKITDCVVCHGSAGHEANHDVALIDSPDCLQCHAGNVVVEHANRGLGCGDCHDNPDPTVQQVIATGKGDPPDILPKPVYCSSCHGFVNHHGSLPPYQTEESCYQCHTSVKSQFNASTDTYGGLGTKKGYYSKVNTKHDVSDADQAYSSTKIECINCHNTDVASTLIDPDNKLIPFTKTMVHPGTRETVVDSIIFCLKCHDNTWAADGTVKGPKTIKNIATRYLDSSSQGEQHGAGPGQGRGVLIGPYASVENGPVPAMPCTDCHDSHGGGGIYHLKTLKDQYNKDITITPKNIGAHDVAHWCSHCHKNPMNQIDGNKVGCISSSCHSHGLNSTW